MTKRLYRDLVTVCVIGLLASLAVGLLWLLAPNLLHSWEWSTYDARMKLRGPASASSAIVIIGRDEESDARFGIGVWDRAIVASVIAGLGRARASVVAPDFLFANASPPGRGGTASDAALIAATTQAGNVVFPVSTSPLLPALAQHARGVGHVAALDDQDGVYRSVPVVLDHDGRPIPAFGVAIAAAFLNVPPNRTTTSIPLDAQGRMLINYAGRWEDGPFPYLSFVDVRDAIQEGRLAELRKQVEGKIVLIVHASLEADKRRTPLEVKTPGGFIHANVTNTILTHSALREAAPVARALLTVAPALLAAWLVLSFGGWRGLGLAAVLAMVYAAAAQASFAKAGLVWPVLPPLFGLVVASGGALVWTTWLATGRVSRLEADLLVSHRALSAIQESLARRESLAERLEEELEAVKAEAGVSAEKKQELTRYAEGLERQAAAAQVQVEATRCEVRKLEAKLAGLTAAAVQPVQLSDAESEQLRRESEALGMVTRDPALLGLFRDLKKAAQALGPILILGETGTGKDLVARAAHALSPRAHGPFIAVNVAAMSPELVESQLFGHVKGAFTGADRDHMGCFEQAHQGTIFLDEIGDLRPETQAKALRVLQEKMFYRVGATNLTQIDVRVVAATNKDLWQGVAQGWFREDLYFRLRGFEFRLPPLRERGDDLALLAEQFVREAATKAGREGLALSQGTLELLKRGQWKGNIRELKNCLERAVILAEGKLITEKDLQVDLGAPSVAVAGAAAAESDVARDTAVLTCLRQHRFDMQETAQALGWDRSTVMQRLKGMCFRALVEHQGDRAKAAAALAGEPSLVLVAQVKLDGYYDNLRDLAARHQSADEALAVFRRRFKNLPERYLPSVEALVRRHFEGKLVDNVSAQG